MLLRAVVIFIFLLFTKIALWGQELIVKSILLEGNHRTKNYIILREISTRAGEPFDTTRMEQDKNRLLNLGIFSEVEITAVDENDSITINILVRERFALIPFPALNYTELDGWSYGGGLLHRNLNGCNRSACGYILLGNSTQFYLTLYDPWITGERVSLQCEMARLIRDHPYENFQQTDTYFWSEIGKRWDYNRWSRLKLGFRRVDSDIPGKTLTGENFDLTPYSLITFIFDNRDLWSNPRQGSRIDLKIGQYGFPWQEPDYRYFYMNYARYFPLKWGRTLALLCAFGEKNGALPPYERFYFGGAYSVRGYEYNYARGDRFFLTGLEYRFNILRPMLILPKLDLGLGGALFWDGGMVWNSGQDLKAIPWYSSCGGGLRFFIPILEVMRLDIAWHPQSKYYLDLAVGMKF